LQTKKPPQVAAEAQKLQNKTNYGKNLKFDVETAKVEKSNIVPEKRFYFLLMAAHPFSASRAITSF
jgi:hypothetical protein